MYDAHETSLSKLSESEWQQVSNRWMRDCDWIVVKMGRKWMIGGEHFKGFGLFKTKTAAYEAATNLILAESHWRAKQEGR